MMVTITRYLLHALITSLCTIHVKSNSINYKPSPFANRVPIIFASNHGNLQNNIQRRRGTSINLRQREIQNTSSRSYSYKRTYMPSEYDDGYDGIDEWDRLDRIKKELQNQLGGYRPWSVDTRSGRPGTYSWTTKLVLANVAFYALQMMMPSVTKFGAKRSELIMQGKELHRLVTPVFLHGSITHLMLNTFSLQNIGPEVERLFGGGRFLCTYLTAGIAGNMMSAYYSPNPSIGASGAVFGLMGAYYAFLSQNERLLGRSGQDAMGRVSGTLAMNVLFGLSSPSIDNWAHIGGALGGGEPFLFSSFLPSFDFICVKLFTEFYFAFTAMMAVTFGPKLSVLGLPGGGSIIVDKPTLRLPPSVESLPGTFSKKFRRAKLRMQVDRYISELSPKPWRRNRGRRKPRSSPIRGPLRNRNPLKPLFGDN